MLPIPAPAGPACPGTRDGRDATQHCAEPLGREQALLQSRGGEQG
ncbi:hypothetical protein ATKI12_6387 [Kitasatospora sp. Ki12]